MLFTSLLEIKKIELDRKKEVDKEIKRLNRLDLLMGRESQELLSSEPYKPLVK